MKLFNSYNNAAKNIAAHLTDGLYAYFKTKGDVYMSDQFNVGQIVNVVGLKGEVKVYPLTDYKERFEELEWVYIDNNKMDIEKVKYNKGLVILKLKDINDRTTAEKYKTKYLKIDREHARELPEDTYYIVDIIGCKVVDENNTYIGIVKDVIQHTSQDLYEVEGENGKRILIPVVEEFVKHVDIDNKIIKVQLIEGLLDL